MRVWRIRTICPIRLSSPQRSWRISGPLWNSLPRSKLTSQRSWNAIPGRSEPNDALDLAPRGEGGTRRQSDGAHRHRDPSLQEQLAVDVEDIPFRGRGAGVGGGGAEGDDR